MIIHTDVITSVLAMQFPLFTFHVHFEQTRYLLIGPHNDLLVNDWMVAILAAQFREYAQCIGLHQLPDEG